MVLVCHKVKYGKNMNIPLLFHKGHIHNNEWARTSEVGIIKQYDVTITTRVPRSHSGIDYSSFPSFDRRSNKLGCIRSC